MANKTVAIGQTDVSVWIRVLDDTDGTPKTDMIASTGGHEIWYQRGPNVAVVTDSAAAADLTLITDAHSDWDFLHAKEGWYRVDLPDAAFIAGASEVKIGMNATGFTGVSITVVIDPFLKFQGQASAATGTTTTFASPGPDIFDGDYIFVVDGTGSGQIRRITVSGLEATHLAWDINISTTTSTIVVLPGDAVDALGGSNVDATVSSRSTLTTAEVNTEVDTALADIELDKLISVAISDVDVADNSALARIASKSATADFTSYDHTTESLEAVRDQGDSAWITGGGGSSDRLLMVDTTIATLASQTEFTLTDGSDDDDAYNNCTIVVEDVSTATQKAVGYVINYTGGTKTVFLGYDPAIYTMATTDKVYILAENALKSIVTNRQLDVSAIGEAVVDKTDYALSSAGIDSVWQQVLTESYATDGAEGTASQILYAIQQFLLDADISGTTMTIRQLDGTTQAYVLTLDNATTPTDKNRTT